MPKRSKKTTRKSTSKKATKRTKKATKKRTPRKKATKKAKKKVSIAKPRKPAKRIQKTSISVRPKYKKKIKAISGWIKLGLVAFAALLLFRWDPLDFHSDRIDPISVEKPIIQEEPKPATIRKETTPKIQQPTKKEVVVTPTVKPKPKPKVTPKKTTPVAFPPKPKVPTRSLSPTKPKLVFVIDDMGNSIKNKQLFLNLSNKITYAILPHLTYSEYFSRMSLKTNAEVILHLPLEAIDGTIPGPGLITTSMPEEQILSTLRQNLNSVPQHSGVNSHMGSKGTANPRLMRTILRDLKRRKLFFLDSYTTPKSVSRDVAKSLGLDFVYRDVFLDNKDTVPAIRKQLEELLRVSKRKGYAIAIGHDYTNTLAVLNQEIPRLEKQGYEVISLYELIRFLKQKKS